MGIKRLFLVLLFALASSVALVPGASAGDFADEPCVAVSGSDTYLCPGGKAGVPYSMKFKLKEGSGCGPDSEIFKVTSGNFPPGLTLASEGNVSGTPTQAGAFDFYVTVTYSGCAHVPSDRRFRIEIQPETPKLVLGPEQTGVPISTVGAPFTLQMTSNLPDAKTWTIAEGALPPGLALGAADGLISGSPTTEGAFAFRVQAALGDGRSDSKWLTITVRKQIAIVGPAAVPLSEVSVPLELALSASGGTETFTWAFTGRLPRGVTFDTTNGAITGTPRRPGTYPIAATATDAEGRTATYEGEIVVAMKLRVPIQRLGAARAGRVYRSAKLRTLGGVLPQKLRIADGTLPLGVRFAPKLGMFIGKPRKAGRFRVTVEATDGLQVTFSRSFVIVVFAAPVKRSKNR